MGRVGVDLYPEQTGVSLAEVTTFAKYLGGTATNVAVAAARYGHSAAVITKVGDDGFGVYVRNSLEGVSGSTTPMWGPIRTCGRRSSSARSIHPTDSRCSSIESPKRRT